MIVDVSINLWWVIMALYIALGVGLIFFFVTEHDEVKAWEAFVFIAFWPIILIIMGSAMIVDLIVQAIRR